MIRFVLWRKDLGHISFVRCTGPNSIQVKCPLTQLQIELSQTYVDPVRRFGHRVRVTHPSDVSKENSVTILGQKCSTLEPAFHKNILLRPSGSNGFDPEDVDSTQFRNSVTYYTSTRCRKPVMVININRESPWKLKNQRILNTSRL